MPRKIAAGNWKMNGLQADLQMLRDLAAARPTAPGAPADPVTMVICPPATLLAAAASLPGPLAIGAQDCHSAPAGAHTGDLSAQMIRDCGARFVITGHSERRSDYGETDSIVAAKSAAAHAAGLTAIICLGETLAQREAGKTLDVVLGQLAGSLPESASAANTVIAYEPVWAIGTGRVAGPAEIASVHAALRAALIADLADGAEVSLLYGGSVKAANAAEIFAVPEVNGALVGGASLTLADFAPIISALAAA